MRDRTGAHARDRSALALGLFRTPSAYGAVAWIAWFFAYETRLIPWEPTSAEGYVACLATIVAFVVSATLHARSYVGLPEASATASERGVPPSFLAVLHLVGVLGLAIYLRDYAAAVGGIGVFFALLAGASDTLRGSAGNITSPGIQISYIGWLAVGLTTYEVACGRRSRWWHGVSLLQAVGNLLFIDRTRPFSILFTAALLWIVGRPGLSPRRLALSALAMVAGGLAVYLSIALWVGKLQFGGGSGSLPPVVESVLSYGTGGFAYFSRIVGSGEAPALTLERTLYPLFKALSALDLAAPPPNQVNEFYFMPIPTNVGTFLEPFYRDGGWPFVVVGIVLHSVLFDQIGLRLLRTAEPFAMYAWSTLCFTNAIGFFTPKINNLPVWLFLGAAAAALVLRDLMRRSPRAVALLTADRST